MINQKSVYIRHPKEICSFHSLSTFVFTTFIFYFFQIKVCDIKQNALTTAQELPALHYQAACPVPCPAASSRMYELHSHMLCERSAFLWLIPFILPTCSQPWAHTTLAEIHHLEEISEN